MRRQDKTGNPLFDDEFWASDPMGANADLARGGSTYEALRKMSTATIVSYVDSLVLDPSHRADVDFYRAELLRREQEQTNKLIIRLTKIATFFGAAATILAAIALVHSW